MVTRERFKEKVELPDKFSALDIPKVQSTENPNYHLRNFKACHRKGLYSELYLVMFPMSLEPVCQKWFYSLKEKDIATWEDVVHVFLEQHKLINVHIQTTGHKGARGTQTRTKWRVYWISEALVGDVFSTYPPTSWTCDGEDFPNDLQPKYRDHMKYLGLEKFQQVHKIGMEIEDDVMKNSPTQQKNTQQNRKKNEGTGKGTEVNLVEGQTSN